MTKNEIIKEAVMRLVEQFEPERIILFGSHARGTADEHSDFDFLVIKRDAVHNRLRTMTLMDHALRGLGIAKDIVILTPEEFDEESHIPGTVARYAAKEGRLLYDRKEKRRRKEGQGVAAARR